MSLVKTLGKNLNTKYSQNLLDSAKTSTTDAILNASNRAIQKAAEVTGDLIGNRIADKMASVSKKLSQNNSKEAKNEIEIPKERYISPEERQKIIDELRLI